MKQIKFKEIISKHPNLLFFSIVFATYFLMIVVIKLNHPYWHDEKHFVSIVNLFGENFSLSQVVDYPAVTGPFFYYLYALWGKLISFNIISLRIFNLIIAVITSAAIFWFFKKILLKNKIALFGFLILFVNPYYLGLSFFVYTDMLNLLLLILFSISVYKKKSYLMLLSGSLALLVRQYSVFLIVAAGLYFILEKHKNKDVKLLNFIFLFLTILPLLILMFIWKGISPPSGFNKWVIYDQYYHFSYIFIYLTFLAVYLLPIEIFLLKNFWKNKKILIYSFVFSLLYFLFPIKPSYTSMVQTNYTTVGLLHRLINKLTINIYIEHLVLWLFFWLGLGLMIYLIKIEIHRYLMNKWDFRQFLTLATVVFILIMPLSYQVWEKYLIMVLPFIILRLLILKCKDNQLELTEQD